MSTLLVAIDFSDCSKEALRRADGMAKALGASIDVVHVWPYATAYAAAMVGSGPPEDAVHRLQAVAAENLRVFCDEAPPR